MFDFTYKTIAQPAEGIYKDKGSKFLSFAYPVTRETVVKEILTHVKTSHPKANHHCYAYRLKADKSVVKFQDDREPANTAGKPILHVIQSNDLTDVLIVVVRYFGGTLLGVPGLIKAYKGAATDAVKNALIVEKDIEEHYTLNFPYTSINEVMHELKTGKAVITKQELNDSCVVEIRITKKYADAFIKSITTNFRLKDKLVMKAISI